MPPSGNRKVPFCIFPDWEFGVPYPNPKEFLGAERWHASKPSFVCICYRKYCTVCLKSGYLSFCPTRPGSQMKASAIPIMHVLVAGGQTTAEMSHWAHCLTCTPLSSFTLQPATCASSPSVRICARLNTLSVATRTCWRAPSLPSCHLST